MGSWQAVQSAKKQRRDETLEIELWGSGKEEQSQKRTTGATLNAMGRWKDNRTSWQRKSPTFHLPESVSH